MIISCRTSPTSCCRDLLAVVWQPSSSWRGTSNSPSTARTSHATYGRRWTSVASRSSSGNRDIEMLCALSEESTSSPRARSRVRDSSSSSNQGLSVYIRRGMSCRARRSPCSAGSVMVRGCAGDPARNPSRTSRHRGAGPSPTEVVSHGAHGGPLPRAGPRAADIEPR